MSARVSVLGGILLSTLAFAGAARGQGSAPPAPAPVDALLCAIASPECGRKSFESGVAAYRAGDFALAIARFTAALEYKRHPAIVLNLGLALAGAGRFLEARRSFDEVRESPEAPPALKGQAATESERAGDELATINVDTGAGVSATVVVDGAPARAAEPFPVDPGPHRVEITLGSGAVIRRSVVLASRERLHLAIDRTQELVVVPQKERVVPAKEPPPRARRSTGLPPVVAYVGVGVTAVLGGVAAWSAFDTTSAHDEYDNRLEVANQAEVNRRVDEGHGLETRTNVLWVATGAAAVGTAVIGAFFVDWRGPGDTSVALGPRGVSVIGAF